MSRHSGATVQTACALIAALAAAALLAAPASAADATACQVRNPRTGVVKGTLQAAVTAARAGDTLKVRGTCHGLTAVRKDLRVIGIRTPNSGRPTLDGDGLGAVVRIGERAAVAITDLAIIDGSGPGMPGGGIINEGHVELTGTTVVRACHETAVYNGGTMVMSGSSSVRANDGGSTGGGVWNAGTLVMRGHSSISDNASTHGPGGVANVGGIVRMFDSSTIRGNRSERSGGGVDLMPPMEGLDGRIVLDDASSIRDNSGAVNGGGIAASGGTVVLRGSSTIAGNHARLEGGGVYLPEGARLTMTESSTIRANTTMVGPGGGVSSRSGVIVMRGSSSIRGNTGGDLGGGVFGIDSSLELKDSSSITGNGPALAGGLVDDEDSVRVHVRCAPSAARPNVHHNDGPECRRVDL